MKLLATAVLLLAILSNINAQDTDSVNDLSVGYGTSSENFDIYRISIKKDLNKYFFEKKHKYLPKYYETSLGYWKGKNSSSLNSFSFAPVFRYTFGKHYKVNPYIEAGIGAAYISKKVLEEENFGTHFQFENIIGIGFKLYDFDISYRYMHYSNGGLSEYNSGADFNVISISYRF